MATAALPGRNAISARWQADPAGRCSGHVDLDRLGVADRWADLAIATWSTEWDYGPGWEGLLLDSYAVNADPRRTSYYRLMWDLDP